MAFDVVYLVVGRGTAALAQRRPGERLSVWGPLGNGFGPPPAGPVVFVAGGIGQTPFLALARSWLGRSIARDKRSGPAASPISDAGPTSGSPPCSITLLYGVRTAALLAGVDDFLAPAIEVELATDDGTAGHHGFVTDSWPAAWSAASGPPGSSAAGRRPCWPPWHAWSSAIRFPATSRSRTTWPAASARASVASPRSARPMARPTCSRVCVEGPVVAADRVDWHRLAH